MQAGRIAKARRGELAIPLPIGFARRPSGEVVLDPDEQVRSVVRLVFDLFGRLGTVGAVLASWRATASSWASGCGRDPSAGSWPGAVPAAP